jgi:S1-C subfamily serine protease
VRLAPFRVKGGAFSISYTWNGEGKVTVARVTLVRAQSPGEKAGLRAGDLLVRIDGREVAGMPHEELARILAADLNPEHPVEIYSFEGKRFFGDDVKVEWKFTYRPDEERH